MAYISPEYPDTDDLLHNRLDALTLEQQIHYMLMVRLSTLLNKLERNRDTGEYKQQTFLNFLNELYNKLAAYVPVWPELLEDDIVSIAKDSFYHLEYIVNLPSTVLQREKCLQRVGDVHRFGTDTMRWLAQRPGRSIKEKIYPENKLLASKTYFSCNTKENQEALYLYNILKSTLRDRFQDIKPSDIKLQKLLGLNMKIRKGELADVKPIKQSTQNNKLMCDPHYKRIWEKVKLIDNIEAKLSKDWVLVPERYAQLAVWLFLAWLIKNKKVKTLDFYGKLQDKDGKLRFISENNNNIFVDNVYNIIVLKDDVPVVFELRLINKGIGRYTLNFIDENRKIKVDLSLDSFFESVVDQYEISQELLKWFEKHLDFILKEEQYQQSIMVEKIQVKKLLQKLYEILSKKLLLKNIMSLHQMLDKVLIKQKSKEEILAATLAGVLAVEESEGNG